MPRNIIFVVFICFTEIHRNDGCDTVEGLCCSIAPGLEICNEVFLRASGV
jgi:hypothetical protein